jgi:2-polyprenyl-6-methoxyphenol hydroxylase-like FAD-dependent oxidoreductase
MRKFFIFLCLNCLVFVSLFAKTPSVLIIGGGASGLATAIEARQAGYHVTVVEKRAIYERRQTLFLLEPSLKLLKKWEVTLPSMKVIEGEEFGSMGIVPIKDLEEGLEIRALALGVEKVHGEFIDFHRTKHEAIVATASGDRFLPYDLIVAADGAHSRVREALGIQPICFGTATASSVFIRFESPEPMGISPAIHKDDYFIRKITLGMGSLVFMQAPSQNSTSEKQLQKALSACGWEPEAKALHAKKVSFFVDGIPIILAQAPRFCDETRGAILVGDAAATASFLQGMGANTALKTASLAGDFFKSKEAARYRSFEEGIQDATDALIEDSRYLFAP